MTTPPADLQAYHQAASSQAIQIYIGGLAPGPLASEWRQVVRGVRKQILRTLIATKGLRDVVGELQRSGKSLLVLRHLFAPPISQDQLKLICPLYPKGAEKNGTKLPQTAAHEFSVAFAARRDPNLTAWLAGNSNPTRRQVKKLLDTLTPMISSQIFNTERRNRMSEEQEKAVETLLLGKGWEKAPSKTVNTPADLPPEKYMRKTRAKASTTATKEVDIACGVRADLLLAMECKVSNDATNSVKRVGDVLDKAKSWQATWGVFIKTAALLQGVVAYKDVARLLQTDIAVFWSHDLERLSDWLDQNG
jgi:hypothetical protein